MSTAVSENETEPEPEPTSDIEPETDAPKKKAKKGKGSGGVRIPDDWPWEEAKKLFEDPDVIPADEVEVGCRTFFAFISHMIPQLEWKNPDVDALMQFLVTEKGFK